MEEAHSMSGSRSNANLCSVTMGGEAVCRRPIYIGALVEQPRVCLMHSRDWNKSDAEFQKEFDCILEAAGTGLADFSGFVFPSANYRGRHFSASCTLFYATFTEGADFSGAEFAGDVNFIGAEFNRRANFSESRFLKRAFFDSVDFKAISAFRKATFAGLARFDRAKFASRADFYESVFEDGANFGFAAFSQPANFGFTKFTQGASFEYASFLQDANFLSAAFLQDADFVGATFKDNADFHITSFEHQVDFELAKFLGPVEFGRTYFRCDDLLVPGPIFCLAEFARPDLVIFYRTDLGQALFHNCDVSRFAFSAVEWRRRRDSGKRMVFDEVVDLHHDSTSHLRPTEDNPDERDFGLIAELYQQLKKNYDERKDYWTAGDFHYGEMEMKRLSSPRKNSFLRALHKNLGLAAWYKYASQYGESYWRPVELLVLVLLIFALLFPVVGLRYNASGDPLRVAAPTVPGIAEKNASGPTPDGFLLTYGHPVRPGEGDYGPKWRARLRLAWHSLWASVFVALFQKDLAYEPVYLAGRILGVVEQALTSTLFGLFLLAVRRQFRR